MSHGLETPRHLWVVGVRGRGKGGGIMKECDAHLKTREGMCVCVSVRVCECVCLQNVRALRDATAQVRTPTNTCTTQGNGTTVPLGNFSSAASRVTGTYSMRTKEDLRRMTAPVRGFS